MVDIRKLVVFSVFLLLAVSLFCQTRRDVEIFGFGVAVSMVNAVFYYSVYFRHRHRIPTYPAQAMVVVVVSTLTRFLLVSALLVWGYKLFSSDSELLLLGFVLGQLVFLFNHLTVVTTNNGK